MAFRLKRRQPLATGLRRHLDRQLQLAAVGLGEAGTPEADDRIHEARRHIKKARAVLRLFAPTLGADGRAANRRLRTISRMLAPIADGEAMLDTLTRIHRRYARRLPARARAAIRRDLQHREARIDQQARAERVIVTARQLLRQERRSWRRWRGTGDRFRMISNGLRATFANARDRERQTLRRFDADNAHAWRRRVKDQWYQVRLLERRCGSGLDADRRRLEALDGCLGELQNAAVLLQVLRAGPGLEDTDRERYAVVVNRYHATLARQARRLAADIYAERPRQFVRRVHRLWRAERRRRASAAAPRRRRP